MFGNDQITEAYLLRADHYWHQKWEELRKSNPRDNYRPNCGARMDGDGDV